MDPAHVALNSARGWALRATIAYAYWVRASRDEEATSGFDVMPEVRQLLETHLHPEHDPSLAVRSVYGQFLPQLADFDNPWLRRNLAHILPDHPELSAFNDAAWGGYIIYARPYDDLLEILQPAYARAVERLATEGTDVGWSGRPRDPDERLADHLMTFYWRGTLPLANDLIPSFFTHAPIELRTHALEFVGRSARHYRELGR